MLRAVNSPVAVNFCVPHGLFSSFFSKATKVFPNASVCTGGGG